ncbi:ATP-binding protein [Aspergillus homomorphus CBS 101889]|uniref:P-loop containing nucleoside triphosphate hydrolase protein n=1 Tax=Aspergillus homomorphus (strain CBS 101889) TaxID=1450537 RepID=A0A395IAX8_ASPHC|nr:P-loop containing nucleoside triphosphate hydrolase protein [Aspergillus homomorphus CBS 101889]RAL17337.1 P-loop containing nucleoside triphosphate hydrolase protein [Aspergillus homomorphus CBS 101889]
MMRPRPRVVHCIQTGGDSVNDYRGSLRSRTGHLVHLSIDQCPDHPFPLLLPRTVKGYGFTEKRWVDLEVDRISDTQWNTQVFESLVLEEPTKDLLEALLKSPLSLEASTDLIPGKGDGLVILLHGGPGTGKTFTAEGLADYARRPLLRITCGDIGTKPVDVERYLEKMLRLGRTWGCVILLDEADVFLKERTLSDLERNALVSVFLRVLEHFDGILILASTRVGHFDEAFRSRIRLALHYQSPGPEQRHQIWSNLFKHLRTLEDCSMDFDDLVLHINDLSTYEMNGRQIRNAITTARQLAELKKKRLNYGFIKKVIATTGQFDRYLQGIFFSPDYIVAPTCEKCESSFV